MNNLIYVPLERLDSRYTEHLDRDILHYLRSNRINYERVEAPFNKPPENGMFLNPANTIKNKAMQIGHIADLYENGTVTDDTKFFFSDLWFPGIESLAYLNRFYNVLPRITGVIHAGSFTEHDFTNEMEWWAKRFEEIMFDIVDTVYLGSKFIMADMISKRKVSCGLVVTGLPLDNGLHEFVCKEKEDIIVFNGRLCDEKQPYLFDELKLGFKGKPWKFVSTHEMALNKREYYTLLGRARVVVSFALQENFGYGIAEAVRLGCLPVLPNRLCYPEMYRSDFLYDDFEGCVKKVWAAMHVTDTFNTPFLNPINNEAIFNTWFK